MRPLAVRGGLAVPAYTTPVTERRLRRVGVSVPALNGDAVRPPRSRADCPVRRGLGRPNTGPTHAPIRRLSEARFREPQVGGRFCVIDMAHTRVPREGSGPKISSEKGLAQVMCVTPHRVGRTRRLR
jgi:hypothetical protein